MSATQLQTVYKSSPFDCIMAVSRFLKEQLSVVGPHVPTSIPDTPGQAEHEHARHDEGFEQEKETFPD